MAKKVTKKDKEKEEQEEQARTTAKKVAILEALEKTLGVVTSACRAVSISPQTFYRWKEDDSDFKKAVQDIDNIALDFAETQLHLKMQGVKKKDEKGNTYYKTAPDTTALIFYLKTKGKGRGYVEKQELDLTTKGDKITQTIDYSKLDTETLLAIEEATSDKD